MEKLPMTYDPSKKPTLQELQSLNLPDAEKLYEIQVQAQEIFSIGLENQKGILSFGNTYAIKPNAILEGFKEYEDLLMIKGEGTLKYLLNDVTDKLQSHFSEITGCSNPKRIVLGVNATTFISQILSNYWGKPLKILTTNLEFYGVTRVLNRLSEIENIQVKIMDASDFDTFEERLLEETSKTTYDILIMSDVFFKSGNILDNIADVIRKLLPKISKIVIDGSSAFGNIVVKEELETVIDEIYYIGAPKKFLGCGDGLVFMSVPAGCTDRPVFTGWLLKDFQNEKYFYSSPILYPEDDGEIYCNSTMEFSVRVRALVILDLFKKINFSFEKQHFYLVALQDYLIKQLEERNISFLGKRNLINRLGKYRPLQTCFCLENEGITAKELTEKLQTRNINCTYKGNVLRICLAIFYTFFDLDHVIEVMIDIDKEILRNV